MPVLYRGSAVLKVNCIIKRGAMAQAMSHMSLTSEVRMRSRSGLCETDGEHSGFRSGFRTSGSILRLSVSLYQRPVLIFVLMLLLPEGQAGLARLSFW